MPHNIETITDRKRMLSIGMAQPPFGPDFSEVQITGAEELVVTGSSFKDPGDDWVKFTLVYADGGINERTIGGY